MNITKTIREKTCCLLTCKMLFCYYIFNWIIKKSQMVTLFLNFCQWQYVNTILTHSESLCNTFANSFFLQFENTSEFMNIFEKKWEVTIHTHTIQFRLERCQCVVKMYLVNSCTTSFKLVLKLLTENKKK